MTNLEIYDPPMCCSTGVCGPDTDQKLVTFAADLSWLAENGVHVKRFNLSQEPSAFVSNTTVNRILNESGEQSLPVIILDGEVVCKGIYPNRAQLVQIVNASLITSPPQDDGDCCGPGSNCC